MAGDSKTLYRVGIIGLGQIASDIDDDPTRNIIWSHAGAYHRHSKTDICSVCDNSRAKIDKFCKKWRVQSSYTDYTEMIAKEELDIVSVCTPTQSHYEIVKNISRMGIKAVFCEKPMAQTSVEAKKMIRSCISKNVVLAVNYMRRWDNNYLIPMKMIKSGQIGALHSVVGYGATALMTSTSHLIDMMLFFGGKPEWIIGVLQKDYIRTVHGAPDPGGFGFIRFMNGALGFLKGVSSSPKRDMFELDILGSEGRIKISGDGTHHCFWKFQKTNTSSKSEYEYLVERELPALNKRCERMLRAIDDIISCIRNGNRPKSNGYTGLDNIKLVECIKISDQYGNKRIYFESGGDESWKN